MDTFPDSNQPTPSASTLVAHIGKRVTVETAAYGQQVGRVASIMPSPFYGETHLTAFVISTDPNLYWSEYVALHNLPDATCTDCDTDLPQSRMCPECGCCLDCCDCPPLVDPLEAARLDALIIASCNEDERTRYLAFRMLSLADQVLFTIATNFAHADWERAEALDKMSAGGRLITTGYLTNQV